MSIHTTEFTWFRIANNSGNPNLETLAKLANVLEIKLSDLIALAEQDRPVKRTLEKVQYGEFHFRRVEIRGVQFFWGEAPAEASITFPPEIHECAHEVCVVLRGALRFDINGKSHIVKPGEVFEFNHNFHHTCHAMEDCEVIAMHFGSVPLAH